jgi:hypothetical protein
MKPLPETKHSLVLRTDFSDKAAWDAICVAIQETNEDGFKAYVDCISDPTYAGLTVEQLVALASKSGHRSFAFLVDRVALANPERPVLVVDLSDQPGRSFRVIPREMWGVENNLRIANMGFDEFADSIDPDGVFRGFPES